MRVAQGFLVFTRKRLYGTILHNNVNSSSMDGLELKEFRLRDINKSLIACAMIRYANKELGITLDELSQILNVHLTAICRWSNLRVLPNPRTCKILIEKLTPLMHNKEQDIITKIKNMNFILPEFKDWTVEYSKELKVQLLLTLPESLIAKIDRNRSLIPRSTFVRFIIEKGINTLEGATYLTES